MIEKNILGRIKNIKLIIKVQKFTMLEIKKAQLYCYNSTQFKHKNQEFGNK